MMNSSGLKVIESYSVWTFEENLGEDLWRKSWRSLEWVLNYPLHIVPQRKMLICRKYTKQFCRQTTNLCLQHLSTWTHPGLSYAVSILFVIQVSMSQNLNIYLLPIKPCNISRIQLCRKIYVQQRVALMKVSIVLEHLRQILFDLICPQEEPTLTNMNNKIAFVKA